MINTSLKTLWVFALVILGGCTPTSEPIAYLTPNIMSQMTPQPTFTTPENILSPTLDLPLIHTVDEITCELQPISSPQNYELDQIVAGESTEEEVKTLLGEPKQQFVEQGWTWLQFGENYAWVAFQNGFVVQKTEPRFRLDEIVAYYGVPIQVVWRIPAVNSHDIWFSTFLLYPEQGVLFERENQIIQFSSKVSFPFGVVTLPSEFNDYLSNYQILTSPSFIYEIFPWPCPQQ